MYADYSAPDSTLTVEDPADGTIWSNAAEYVKARWNDFLALESRIVDLQHRAALAAQTYTAQGKTELANAAKALIRELGELNQLHGKIVDRFRELAPYVGLGAVQIPVILATAFSTAAIVLLWYFRKFDIQEKALEALEAGTLSEQAFMDMNAAVGPSPLREGMNLAKLALWAFLGWLAFQMFNTAAPALRRTPPLVVFGNPPELISGDALEIAYIHADDGQPYIHEFEGNVEIEALPDGSVLISHPTKPVWRDF
mgnify:CR=1 FL=1